MLHPRELSTVLVSAGVTWFALWMLIAAGGAGGALLLGAAGLVPVATGIVMRRAEPEQVEQPSSTDSARS